MTSAVLLLHFLASWPLAIAPFALLAILVQFAAIIRLWPWTLIALHDVPRTPRSHIILASLFLSSLSTALLASLYINFEITHQQILHGMQPSLGAFPVVALNIAAFICAFLSTNARLRMPAILMCLSLSTLWNTYWNSTLAHNDFPGNSISLVLAFAAISVTIIRPATSQQIDEGPDFPQLSDEASDFPQLIDGSMPLPFTLPDMLLAIFSFLAIFFALNTIGAAADDHFSAGIELQSHIDFVLFWTVVLLLLLLISDHPRKMLGGACVFVAIRYAVGILFLDERQLWPIALFFLISAAAYVLLRRMTAQDLGPFRPTTQHTRTRFIAAFVIIAAFVPADKLSIYHPYAYAIAWHCFHGNHTEIAGHRVTLPLLWWKEKSHTDYDTYLLRRASPANPIAESEILVSPEKPQDILDTDEKVLKNQQDSIASVNSKPHRFSPWTLVVVHPTAFTLYCTRATFGLPSLLITNVSLFCRATRLPYSFNFRGSGYGKSPIYESEATSILSSLE